MSADTKRARAAAALRERTAMESLPMGVSYTVKRDRLIRDAVIRGAKAGIVLVCAPDGFGKTAFMLQYAEEIRTDPARGHVHLIEAAGSCADELYVQLKSIEEEISPDFRPLIAFDNVPRLERSDLERFVSRLRDLRSQGFEFLLTCTPDNRTLVYALGDSFKVGAQTLRVHPREYSNWAHVFSIPRAVDVYGLTQGIPSLVAALQALDSGVDEPDLLLQQAVVNISGEILAELRADDEALFRYACLLMLVGEGNLAELERCGARTDEKRLGYLLRDYPIFGIDATTRDFRCLSASGAAYDQLCDLVVSISPDLALKAVRVHFKAGRMEEGVALAKATLSDTAAFQIVSQYSVRLALAGEASFVAKVLSGGTPSEDEQGMSVLSLLGAYVAALTLGDIRLARAAASVLAARADEIPNDVPSSDWASACAAARAWATFIRADLPDPFGEKLMKSSREARIIDAHARFKALILRTGVDKDGLSGLPANCAVHDKLYSLGVPEHFIYADQLFLELFDGSLERTDQRDEVLATQERYCRERRLEPLLHWSRVVLGARRLALGNASGEVSVFTDAQTFAIRMGDLGFQLLCILFEGWHCLISGKVVNAQFRGQQVQQLATKDHEFLGELGYLLETAARLRGTSRVGVREEAEAFDLAQGEVSPARAWAYALLLSAARFDSELSAWCSLHKQSLFQPEFRVFASMALCCMGERGESMCRLIPERFIRGYILGNETRAQTAELDDVVNNSGALACGLVSISLFGGFKVERNGHVLTDEVWKRRRCSTLAARLSLGLGSFVGRKTLTEEMWPELDYDHAKANLYATLSTLRHAMGQVKGGPTYVLVQGESISINSEYVTSDVARFQRLARTVMLGQPSLSAPQLIEICLKIEEIYTGPLYVPNTGSAVFFTRMRALLQSKFIDCMVRGADVALEEGDLGSATWLIEAALRQDPLREDLLRSAMRVYDVAGRRREVLSLYGTHLRYLERSIGGYPEPETRELYEGIVSRAKLRGVM